MTRIHAPGKMKIFRGEGIAPGAATGVIHIFTDVFHADLPAEKVHPSRIPVEKRRFLDAFEATRKEINALIDKVHREIGFSESAIFQAHLLIVNDRKFSGEMLRLIEEGSLSAASAVSTVMKQWETSLAASSLPQVQSKVFDIIDIGKRILSKLAPHEKAGAAPAVVKPLPHGRNVILVTRILLPSLSAFIDRSSVTAVATELGNKASHSAVIAKSLGLPAVFGIPNLLKHVRSGDEMIVDGSSGNVFLNPTPALKREYESIKKKFLGYRKKLENITDLPAVTRDGHKVELYANIGALADVETALKYNARGIGLYRTEMPFLIRNEFPNEELQYSVYRKVVEKMKGRPINIRTLDLGGDKVLSFLSMPKEENPNLGWRAIRVFLDHPKFFKIQLKAILRAAVYGDVRIILPMISDLTEVRITRKILAEAKRELAQRRIPFKSNVPLGIMVEVPSAVLMAEHLIREVDFFSVGTNDLIQYTLAVDRNSEKAARFFEPLNPAILSMLRMLITATSRAGKSITICGEIASDPLYVPLLVGMGYRKLSVNPLAINMVKHVIRSISAEDTRRLVQKVWTKKTGKEIRETMHNYLAAIRTDTGKPLVFLT